MVERYRGAPRGGRDRRGVGVLSGPAVVTVAAGRAGHLASQRAGLAAGSLQPAVHVVVCMGDDVLADSLLGTGVEVVRFAAGERLPLAAARNAGARVAAERAGALVFLDVDVIPGSAALQRYSTALDSHRDALLSGPVAYLPADATGDLHRYPPHPARPAPPAGVVVGGGDPRLFWSLSFALTTATWSRIGGFDEAYVGYGGEDTDFALRARACGVELAWVGGATGYHQHHPVSSPPVEHLDDILRNGALFAQRWGWWPMEGWLTAFAAQGLVRREGGGWVAA